MGYEAFVYLPSDTNVTVEIVRKLLESLVEKDALLAKGESALVATFEGWSVTIHLSRAKHVVEEAEETASNFAKNRSDRDEIAASSVRLEVSTDDDDDMGPL